MGLCHLPAGLIFRGARLAASFINLYGGQMGKQTQLEVFYKCWFA
jgi:hypothetical protein